MEEVEVVQEGKNDTSNAERVQFAVPIVKKIVSPHSGTILAKPDPIAPLDLVLKDKAVNAFKEIASGQSAVSRTVIMNLLRKCGFNYSDELLEPVITKLYSGPADLDEGEWMLFIQKFNAPEYYFGQHLRRNAGRGQLSAVIELLVRNCDVNAGDGEGLTSLHYASEFNHCAVIRALVNTVPKGKLIVDCQDKYGWTPLYCAAHHGNLEVVNLLLELGASPHVKNNVGKNVLHAACAQGRLAIADCLLKAAAAKSSEKALITAQDLSGMTPLHETTYRGHNGLFQILSRHANADLTVRDLMGYTASDYLTDFKTGIAPVVDDLPQPPSAVVDTKGGKDREKSGKKVATSTRK